MKVKRQLKYTVKLGRSQCFQKKEKEVEYSSGHCRVDKIFIELGLFFSEKT